MKITHKQLESCRRDPGGWVSTQVSVSPFFNRGYDACLRDAIFQFHRKKQANLSRDYLESGMSRAGFNNFDRIESTLRKLDSYIEWIDIAGVTVLEHRFLLNLDLGSDASLRGLIGRIDLTNDGYRAILFEERTPTWDQELRMPLIQLGVASAYGRPANEMSVGLQELDSSNLLVCRFDGEELAIAEAVAQDLAAQVARQFARYSR